MEQEEPRQPQGADHLELLLQPPPRPPPLAPARVPVIEPGPTDLGQRPVGVGVLRARVPVAEVAGQVEAEPLGDPGALRDGVGMLREAGGHRRRRGQMGRGVPTPLGLGLLERPPQAHGDQRVLKRRSRGVVHVDVAARHAPNPEPPGETLQPAIARPVVAPERPLQLDPEALGAEGARPAGAPAPRPPAPRAADGRPPARSNGPASAPSRAHPERQTSPSARCSSEVSGSTGGRGSRSGLGRVSRCASVISRHRFRHPVAALDQKREMKRPGAIGDRQLAARRSGAPRTPCTPARTPSLPRRRRGRSGRGPRSPAPPPFAPAPPAPTPRRGTSRRSGSAALRSSRSRWRNQRPPSAGSRKTTTLRPSASTSSK